MKQLGVKREPLLARL